MQIPSQKRALPVQLINSSFGFTLIEVLVAIIIFAVGLLSLAASQSFALVTIHNAMQRTVAAQLTAQFIEISRLNRDLIQQDALQGLNTDSYWHSDSVISEQCSSDAQSCSAQAMLDNQVDQWLASVQRNLPEPQVQLQPLTAGHYLLKLSWLNKAELISTETSNDNSDSVARQTLSVYFVL